MLQYFIRDESMAHAKVYNFLKWLAFLPNTTSESASSPLVGFGWLNDNMIKDLTFSLSVKQEIGYLTDA